MNLDTILDRSRSVLKYYAGLDIHPDCKEQRELALGDDKGFKKALGQFVYSVGEVYSYLFRYGSMINESAIVYTTVTNQNQTALQLLAISEVILRGLDIKEHIQRKSDIRNGRCYHKMHQESEERLREMDALGEERRAKIKELDVRLTKFESIYKKQELSKDDPGAGKL